MPAATPFKVQKRSDYKAPDFTALDIELTFDLADDYTVVRSVAHYKRLTSDRRAPLRLDGEELELREVQLNGMACQSSIDQGQLVIENVPDEFELTVENVISPARNSLLMGLYKNGSAYCTQCEPEGFRRITYFLDRPDVLARYKVTIIAPDYGCSVLLSNGNLIAEGERGGRRYCTWEDPFPKPSYLFALVAGTFDIIRDTFRTKSGRSVSLELYVDPGCHDRGLWAMRSIKQAMAWDEARFGLEYDLDNFKVVAVDFFNQGAMENKSLNIFNSIYVLTDKDTGTDRDFYNVQSVIGHEYFHNWTGDRVTLRDWFQLSLKESLTTFRDQEFSSDVASRAVTRLQAIHVIRTAQFAEDASPMSHPVRPEQVMEMNNFYSVTIYDKGAEVIRMIHSLIGEECFRCGLTLYLTRYDGKAATIDDFVSCMAEVSGRSFEQFMRWYTQDGTPQVEASWTYLPELKVLRLKLKQQTAPTVHQKNKLPLYIPLRTSFMHVSGRTVTPPELPADGIVILDKAEQSYDFSVEDNSVIPVLLRDFSAPVRLNAPYTDADLQHLAAFCDDPFIKMDSTSNLIKRWCNQNAAAARAGEPVAAPKAVCSALGLVLADSGVDPNLTAMMVDVPAVTDMMEYADKIDLDALQVLQRELKVQVASSLYDQFADIYKRKRSRGAYRYSMQEAGRRALVNLALKMLTTADVAAGQLEKADERVQAHYQEANNLTDRLSALRTAVHSDLPCAGVLCEEFQHRYDHDTLVYDYFFRVQATAENDGVVYKVRKLMQEDPHFSLLNPNRVRALLGTLVQLNPCAFHRTDGTGYVLLTDVVRSLNGSNAMVAAKLLGPILSFRRFDPVRQQLMRECLLNIRSIPALSRSILEKVDAALQAE